MIALLQEKRAELAALCRQFGVERLYVFGSAATGAFDPSRSDLDFLVEMADRKPTGEYAERYLGFVRALEQLFGRGVDLVSVPAIRNPFFRREVEATQELVYGQPREEAAI